MVFASFDGRLEHLYQEIFDDLIGMENSRFELPFHVFAEPRGIELWHVPPNGQDCLGDLLGQLLQRLAGSHEFSDTTHHYWLDGPVLPFVADLRDLADCG